MKTPDPLPVTQLLADFVAGLHYDRLPEAVREEARLAIADTVGGAIAAVTDPVTQSVMRVVDGETGDCPIWATRTKTTARNAALVNGTMAHAHDIDDTNPSMRGHPSCPVTGGPSARLLRLPFLDAEHETAAPSPRRSILAS